MDNPDIPEPSNVAVNHVQTHKSSKVLYFVIPILLIFGALTIFYIYHTEQSKANKISQANQQLTSQTLKLNDEIKKQQDINSGAVAASAVYKDPQGKIGLVNGSITMNLPNGWVRTPASDCTGGTIDSTAVCQDIATVTPSKFVKSDGTNSWGATVSVFSYNNSDGSARHWYESIYNGSPLSSYGTPQAINISEAPINGYSALIFQWAGIPPINNPDYTNAEYTVVHGKYAVVLTAQVQASTVYGDQAFDYRSTYMPLLNQMIKSIKFQD